MFAHLPRKLPVPKVVHQRPEQLHLASFIGLHRQHESAFIGAHAILLFRQSFPHEKVLRPIGAKLPGRILDSDTVLRDQHCARFLVVNVLEDNSL